MTTRPSKDPGGGGECREGPALPLDMPGCGYVVSLGDLTGCRPVKTARSLELGSGHSATAARASACHENSPTEAPVRLRRRCGLDAALSRGRLGDACLS